MDFEELKDWISYVHSPYYPPSNNLSIELFVQSIGKEPRPDFKFERQIAIFEGYLHTLESYLEQEIQRVKNETEEIRAKVAKEFDKLREEVKAGRISSDPVIISRYEQDILVRWEDPSIYEHYRLEEIGEFADTLRKSFFINLYGFWESQLFPLCKALEHYENMPEAGNARDYPSRAKKFLNKINVSLGDGRAWCTIKDYGQLRNCLVHNNGELERCKEKDQKNIKSFILSKQPLLSIKGQGDVFLNAMNGVLVRQGKPQFYSQGAFRKLLSDSGEISFKKGDVIYQTENINVFQEDVTLQQDRQLDSAITIKLKNLEEKEKIVFREGKTVISHINDPVNFQKADAVIFRDRNKVVFRRKATFQEGDVVVINKGFCEESLKTVNSYFDELLTALGNWALSQTAS